MSAETRTIHSMRRIAYCSPINPIASGISDYSEELLPYLGRYADLTLFVERGLKPADAQLADRLEVRALDELPALHARRPFDALVYQLGNSPAHGSIYELSLALPGVAVLHEWVLHHLKLWHAAERRRDVGAYLREMEQRYGSAGARTGRMMARGQLQDAAFRFPLVEDVVEHAAGLIGHSRYVVEQALALRPGLPAQVVPMGVPLPPALDRDAARQALGLPAGAPIWASFGHINPYKRMESALRAFRGFRSEQPDALYLLVGSVSPSFDLTSLVRRLQLSDAVLVTGYVPRLDFERYVAAADLCLNLRYPTAGETSASLLRLLGAGRPTLVSAIGAFAELTTDVCAPVDVDASEADLILAYARLLLGRPDLAAQLGRNARAFVAREHSLERAAAGYAGFLAALYGWGETRATRPVLWEKEEPRTKNQEPRTKNQEPRTKNQEPGNQANQANQANRGDKAQELGAKNRRDESSHGDEVGNSELETRNSELGARNSELETRNAELETRNLKLISEAAAEIGVQEDDEPVLRDIATALRELLG